MDGSDLTHRVCYYHTKSGIKLHTIYYSDQMWVGYCWREKDLNWDFFFFFFLESIFPYLLFYVYDMIWDSCTFGC